jgi:hypothetical protein
MTASLSSTHRTVPPVRRWASRVGAVALVGIGVAHTVVNTRGYAAHPDGSLPAFLLLVPGVSLLAFAIAVAAWRYGSRVTAGAAIRTVVAVGAVLLCLTAVTVLRGHPALVWVPLGPGPWSVVGGLALAVAAVAPSGRPRARSGRAR